MGEPTSSVALLVLVCSPVSTSSSPCTSRGEPACKKSSTSPTTTVSHSFDLQLHCKIKVSSCRLLRLYKTMFKSIVYVSDRSNVKINIKKAKKKKRKKKKKKKKKS